MNPQGGSSAGTIVTIGVITVILTLTVTLVIATIRQQRRYLRTRKHLGGRLLTAQDEERAAIARELHDDVVQRLIAGASRLRGADAPIGQVVAEDLDELVRSLRGLARGIHPAIVDHLGLDAALTDLTVSFGEREGIAVHYVGPAAPDLLLPAERLALYRVTQEALGNIARHAGVDQAWVQLTFEPKETRLVIEDKGRGFDRRRADRGPGIGVTSMSERLMILGGTLTVDSAPAAGTRVTATLPRPLPA